MEALALCCRRRAVTRRWLKVSRGINVKLLDEEALPTLYWNPWLAFYCTWLKAMTANTEESVMRKYIRHPSDIPINFRVSSSDKPKARRIKDVSVGGLCFNSDQPVAKGTPIHIHIPVVMQPQSADNQQQAEDLFDADGVVAWCRREGCGYSVGVQFADANTRFGLRMVEQICHIEHYRADVLQEEGRALSSEEAAREWVERYAADFPR